MGRSASFIPGTITLGAKSTGVKQYNVGFHRTPNAASLRARAFPSGHVARSTYHAARPDPVHFNLPAGDNYMTTVEKLREISMVLHIHKRLEKNELIAMMSSLVDIAERLEKLESKCPGIRK